MKSFSDPIWDFRLQAIWILYTAIYIFIGRVSNERVVSSIAILIGGILVVSVFIHILVEKDSNRARTTLLVALAATIYFVKESIDVYNDYLAAIFSGIFGLQFLTLILLDENSTRTLLKYRFFSTMSLVLIASSILLLVTIIIKFVIKEVNVGAGYYLAGPLGTGAFAGLAIGGVVGNRLLPRVLPDMSVLVIRKRPVIYSEVFLYSLVIAFLAFKFNDERFMLLFGSFSTSIIVALLYSAVMITVPVLMYKHILSTRKPLDSFNTYLKVLFSCFLVAVVNTLIVDIAAYFTNSGKYSYLTRFLYVEAPVFLMLGVSLIIWQVLIRNICRSISTYEQPNKAV